MDLDGVKGYFDCDGDRVILKKSMDVSERDILKVLDDKAVLIMPDKNFIVSLSLDSTCAVKHSDISYDGWDIDCDIVLVRSDNRHDDNLVMHNIKVIGEFITNN